MSQPPRRWVAAPIRRFHLRPRSMSGEAILRQLPVRSVVNGKAGWRHVWVAMVAEPQCQSLRVAASTMGSGAGRSRFGQLPPLLHGPVQN